MLVVCCLLVAPFGSSAYAAPILIGATLDYSDAIGPLGPFGTTVGAGPEFCGAAGAAGCSGSALTTEGILLQDDFIDFDAVTVVFALEGGGDPDPANPGYRFLGLASMRFGISNLLFTDSGVLVGVGSSMTDAKGAVVTFDGTTRSIDVRLDNFSVKEGGLGFLTVTLQARPGTEPEPVPEPASLMLLGAGLAATAGARRRRSSREHQHDTTRSASRSR
jgi:hypothetical protein